MRGDRKTIDQAKIIFAEVQLQDENFKRGDRKIVATAEGRDLLLGSRMGAPVEETEIGDRRYLW